MRHWLWRLMGVFSLGGGFTGLIFVFIALMSVAPFDFWNTITAGIAAGFYGFGVWSGLRLLEGRPGAAQINLLYWWVQIPLINTPVIAFQFYSGASVTVRASLGWDQTGTDITEFSANAVFGTLFEWSYMQGDVPWEIGVNLLACFFVWRGRCQLRWQEGCTQSGV